MVEAPVGSQFEVLRGPIALGIGIIEGIGKADAFNGFLPDAIEFQFHGWRDADHLVERGHDVDDMLELIAQPAPGP